MSTEIFSAAITYLERYGFSVIPLGRNSKRPAIEWEPFQRRRPTLEELDAWFTNGDANIGIVTGAISGLVVLDIDGPEGEASMRGLEVPLTKEVRTPRGRHLYFEHPGNTKVPTAVGFLPHVDVRGDGGYVVAPPSIVNGTTYVFVRHG